MKRRRALLLTTTVVLALCTACGAWVHIQQQEYARNRQLIAALRHDDTQTALALVNAGADPSTRQTPLPPPTFPGLLNQILHRSPSPGGESPTAFLLACGAWFNQEEGIGKGIRWLHEDVSLVQAMLAHGADVHGRLAGKATALHAATSVNHLHTVELLVQHGAEVNAQTPDGSTPLLWAAIWNRADIARLLLAHGANPNVQDTHGRTALHDAVSYGAGTDLVSELLTQGADPNLRDTNGDTPLRVAQQAKRADMVRLLQRNMGSVHTPHQ